MNWVKGFAVVTCLATPLSLVTAVSASADPTAASAANGTKLAALTEDEKKAKSADCTKQADTKKLHGEARRKFRAQCKKGG